MASQVLTFVLHSDHFKKRMNEISVATMLKLKRSTSPQKSFREEQREITFAGALGKDVRGVSWSEVATVPKRKSHRGLDFNFSWNSGKTSGRAGRRATERRGKGDG